jgi:hypothetical protein
VLTRRSGLGPAHEPGPLKYVHPARRAKVNGLFMTSFGIVGGPIAGLIMSSLGGAFVRTRPFLCVLEAGIPEA